MNVKPVFNNYYNPVFSSNRRVITSRNSDRINQGKSDYQSTYLLRDDMHWDKLIWFLNSHFQNKDKVNVKCLACSDGTEAYSFILSAMHFLNSKDTEKFLPVVASDIDDYIINIAKSRKLNLFSDDIFSLDYYRICAGDFFSKTNKMHIENDIIDNLTNTYRVSPSLAKNVKFKKASIMGELDNIKDNSNTVLLCRNVFLYFKDKEIQAVVDKAASVLKKGSVFVIGQHDLRHTNVDMMLEDAGFEPYANTVYIKK